MLLSISSIMLPALLSPESNIKVDLDTASWIASIIGAGGILGFMLSAIIMEVYGRKRAYIFSVTLSMVGWICVYFGTAVPVLLIGRLLGGVSNCSTASIGSVVIGEYTNPRIRSVFLNLKVAGIWCGILLLHILGHFLYWKTVILVPVTLAVTSFAIVSTWPESPSWFASKNNFRECERTFYWLRGKSTDSVQELKELIEAQQIAPHMLANFKVHGTFVATGAVMFIMLVSLWFVLPETKDKTLQEIENYFNHGRYSVVDVDNEKLNKKPIKSTHDSTADSIYFKI
ncbi:facilitated trehalose transporter Tret1-like [Aricia agestis]|uniref:facilitated trehalose transporter Tret1-like n=1 Tax=Aricia agestis TaxID=91739 RepID=UPI001C202FC6|nr:facilitated trehalose transporter Tret1-like [Aricia agestis]